MSLLTCNGLSIGRFSLPPFRLGAGQLMHLPVPTDSWPERGVLIRTLAGELRHSAIEFGGRGEAVFNLPVGYRRFSDHPLCPITAVRWVRHETGCRMEEAVRQLERVGLDPLRRLATLAGNPRKLMALAAARVSRPDLIVVSTECIDYRGLTDLLGQLVTGLDETAAIHVDPFPEMNVPEIRYDVEVTCTPSETARASA